MEDDAWGRYGRRAGRRACRKMLLRPWVADAGFRLVFLDAPSGHPRSGIADALVFRVKPRSADEIELYVVQLKGATPAGSRQKWHA